MTMTCRILPTQRKSSLSLMTLVLTYTSVEAFLYAFSPPTYSHRSGNHHVRRIHVPMKLDAKSKTTKSSKIKTNDAVLNSLEGEDEPSPDSLADLRDATSERIASFLSAFSNEKESSSSIEDDDDNDEAVASDGDESSITSKRNSKPRIEWDVYVCQSKPCKERGASATLDAFQSLVPPDVVQIHPAYLHKTKAKGPNIRCIQRMPPSPKDANGKVEVDRNPNPPKAFEVNNVNDIDKVYRILTEHMGITNISVAARDCLKYTYQGNAHLEKNELDKAISSYNAALNTGYDAQEGIVLLLRATAYLKRAFQHQAELRKSVQDLAETVPDPENLGRLYNLAAQHPSLSKPLFQKVLTDSKKQDGKFRQTKFRHGLYEYALLHAAQDALRSTQILPHHAKTWLRAGDALAELRKLKESAMYYQKAIDLDPTLRDRLEPVIERLERSQRFLDKAKGWWSSDTLRLALDVAG